MKERIYLKAWLDNTLITIEFLIIAFFATTCETLGTNATYDKIAFGLIVVFIINFIVLVNYSKTIIKANK